ncbi:hypothetical protein [Fortiea sp. LEGE XX443]|uniref:hypothetical protein n=1 Tax=Fortiea sp. LEGE XX443 TaxID=1828611 RepID=UPI001D1485C3|nr:hypothetical protein [Fortiea sp. LEGE XX443]
MLSENPVRSPDLVGWAKADNLGINCQIWEYGPPYPTEVEVSSSKLKCWVFIALAQPTAGISPCPSHDKREFDGDQKPLSKPLPCKEEPLARVFRVVASGVRGFKTLIFPLETSSISAPLRVGEGLGRGSSNSR